MSESMHAEGMGYGMPSENRHERGTDQERLAEVLRLKDLWNLQPHVQQWGIEPTAESLAAFSEAQFAGPQLLESDMYATDVVAAVHGKTEAGERGDARMLQDGEEIAARAEFVRALIRDAAPKDIADGMERILGAYLASVRGKKVLTRPGIEAVTDIVGDRLLTAHIVETTAAETFVRDQKAVPDGVPFVPAQDAYLPDAVREWIEALPEASRQQAEDMLHASEIEAFKDVLRLVEVSEAAAEEHAFETLGAGEGMPLELQVLLTDHPEVADDLKRVMESKAQVMFHTRVKTSHDTVSAIHRISLLSQHKFQVNWLKDFILKGREPKLTAGEDAETRREEQTGILAGLQEKIAEKRAAIAGATDPTALDYATSDLEELEKKASVVRGELEAVEGADLHADLETVRGSVAGYKDLVAMQPDRETAAERLAMRNINTLLADINKEYALRRMAFDLSGEQTHEAQEIVKKLMFVGPIAHGLESLDLGTIAKLFTSSADDLLGEYAEMKALMGAGYSTKDLLKRAKILVPVFGAASIGAAKVEELIKEGHEAGAGALFGATAVALSLTTTLQSMKMYRDGYEALLREGKVSGASFVAGSPEFKAAWKAFSDSVSRMDKAALIAKVSETLDTLGDALDGDAKDRIREDLQALSQEEIAAIVERNTDKEAWMRAIQQDFNNPVRLGVLIGSATAPVLGMGLGTFAPSVLRNGFVLAGIGSTESIIGGLTVMGARMIDDLRWKLELKERLAQGESARTI